MLLPWIPATWGLCTPDSLTWETKAALEAPALNRPHPALGLELNQLCYFTFAFHASQGEAALTIILQKAPGRRKKNKNASKKIRH